MELPEAVVEVTRYASDDSTAHLAPRYVKGLILDVVPFAGEVDGAGKKAV